MHLTSSQLRYLFVLKQIKDERGAGKIKLEDLSKTLKVSKPSVHRMMEVFKELGILEGKRGITGLTELGIETADRYGEQYRIIVNYLSRSMGLGEDTAEEVAISILGCSESAREEYMARISE